MFNTYGSMMQVKLKWKFSFPSKYGSGNTEPQANSERVRNPTNVSGFHNVSDLSILEICYSDVHVA